MNIGTGAKRLAYFFLAIIWVSTIALNFRFGAAAVGEAIAYLLVFTAVYMIFGAGVAWVYRGFRGSK